MMAIYPREIAEHLCDGIKDARTLMGILSRDMAAFRQNMADMPGVPVKAWAEDGSWESFETLMRAIERQYDALDDLADDVCKLPAVTETEVAA